MIPGPSAALPPECERASRGEFSLSTVSKSSKSGKQGRALAPFLGRSKLVLAEAVVKCIYKERQELAGAAAVSAASLQLALIAQGASLPAVSGLTPVHVKWSRIPQALASARPQLPISCCEHPAGSRGQPQHPCGMGTSRCCGHLTAWMQWHIPPFLSVYFDMLFPACGHSPLLHVSFPYSSIPDPTSRAECSGCFTSGFTSDALVDERLTLIYLEGCWCCRLALFGAGCISDQDFGRVYMWEPAQSHPNYHLKWIS